MSGLSLYHQRMIPNAPEQLFDTIIVQTHSLRYTAFWCVVVFGYAQSGNAQK